MGHKVNDPNVLCIDGQNLLHRARSGFTKGDHAIKYNFFRGFKALVERFSPTRCYFVREGHPKHRYDLLPSYKENRKIDPADEPRVKEMREFFAQCDSIVELLSSHFPVSVVQHPDYECDDTIHNLIHTSSSAVPWVVVSNDSDFTQLLNTFDNVSVYNPMLKKFVEHPGHDYVLWKALRGDGSDCIPGIKGIGDKTATSLVRDPDRLEEYIRANTGVRNVLERNIELIKFSTWESDETRTLMTSSTPVRDWDAVKAKFEEWQFNSMIKDSYWNKFVGVFDPMFV